MPTISIKIVRTGRFKTGAALRSVVEKSGTVQDGRESALDTVRAGTPRVSGRLAGSWEALPNAGAWDGSTYRAQAQNVAPYARRVDLTSKRGNKGWVARAISQARVRAVQRMKSSASGIARQLWDQQR